MIRGLVMTNDPLLADAMVPMLTEEIDANAIGLTRCAPGNGNHPSIVIVVDEGKRETEPMFCSSLYKTQDREKRDGVNFVRAFCRI